MSGGTSIYEAAACGVPMLLLPTADNQVKQSKAWAGSGAAVYLGRFGEVSGTQLLEALSVLVSNSEILDQMSLAGCRLVDGCGAVRVARSVARLSERLG